MRSSSFPILFPHRAFLAAAAGCILVAGSLKAQGIGGLSDLDIEFKETKLTLESTVAENEALKRRNQQLEDSVRGLSSSLAQANSEAEIFRRQYTDVKLRMEALGLESIGSDKSRLEQRLLKAVRDLQIEQKQKEHVSEQLVQFSEAVLTFLKDKDDPQKRADLEMQLRESAATLGYVPAQSASAARATLSDAMVISLKDDWLVVTNVGTKAGVKLGMPFRVMRDDQVVGTVQIVNVRDEISGAVIQGLTSNKTRIKVGDRLRVDAR